MIYRDPDSGLEFSSYDEYMRERLGFYDQRQSEPSIEELCDHAYAGDDSGVGRCYCGLQLYPLGGPPAPTTLSMYEETPLPHGIACSCSLCAAASPLPGKDVA